MKNEIVQMKLIIEFCLSGMIMLLCWLVYFVYHYNQIRKEKEKLQQSEEILKTIINSLPDIICYKDGRGRWIEANDAIIQLYDTAELIIGKTDEQLKELMPNYEREFEDCYRTDEIAWNNKRATMVEESFHQRDGSTRTFDVVKVPLFFEDGRRKGLAVLGRDITERKRTEEIQRQSEEKDKLLLELKNYNEIRTEFFANLSHELRTPLNLIISSLKMIQIENEDILREENRKFRRYYQIMRQNSFRLIKIVNNLIDITKIDAGYLEPNFRNVNIISLVEDITLSIISFAEQNQLYLQFDTNVEEERLCCDPYIIERIMLNLLSNAVKFTPAGGKIEVEVMAQEEHIEISIKDTGIGIPLEKQESIFERFVQVDKSLSRNREGSGIGLSLVKAFVEMHGGSIRMNREYREGSQFIVHLPRQHADEEIECPLEEDRNHDEERIQIINVEFSDIYS